MGGPAYDPQPGNSSPFRFPNYFKGVPLFYEWSRDYIKEFRLNGPNLAEIRPFDACRWTTRWTSSTARTARSTCSSTATATSPRTRTRSSRDQLRPRQPHAGRQGRGRRGRRACAADGGVLQRGHHRPRRRPDRLRVGLRGRRQGRLAPTPTRRSRTTKNGTYRATLHVTDRTGRSASAEVQVLVGNAAAGGRADHDAARGGPVPVRRHRHLRGQGHRRHAGRLLEGHRRVRARPRDRMATRSPRPRAAPARSRRSWMAGTPARRTSAPCSSPPTPIPVRAARPA